jgi:hypothetical protein
MLISRRERWQNLRNKQLKWLSCYRRNLALNILLLKHKYMPEEEAKEAELNWLNQLKRRVK